MEVSKKRKRDADCPRITYDATTKVFDRLFKEESLEEMKNVVRKKFGLSPSLAVHLTQLRDGKSVVLEDDDDFDAFYASVHSTPITKIKVSFGDDHLPTTSSIGHEAFTGGPMQFMESPTVHHAAADGHHSSLKRKVTFVDSISEPLRDNVEKPKKIQRKVALDEQGQPPPNSEAPPEVSPETSPEASATINVISAGDETHDDTKKKKTQNKKENKKKGKAADPTLEVQSDMAVVEASGSNSKESTKKAKGHVNVSGNTPYDATKSKKRPRTSTADDSVQPITEMLVDTTALGVDDTEGDPRSSKKSKQTHENSEDLGNATTDPTDDNQADTGTNFGPEHHIPSNGEADPSEVDVLTRLPKEMKKSRNQKQVVEVVITGKKSNAASSASKSKSRTLNSAIVVQRARKSDPQQASGLETDSKGNTKISGPNKISSTHTKPALIPDETQFEKETISSISAGGKTMKKSRKKEAPVGPLEADSAQDQALGSDVMAATRAAVNAILARKSLPSKGSRETLMRPPLVDAITSSLSATPIAPVTSNSPPDDHLKSPSNASTTAEQPKITPKCPICNRTPYHVRSRCPIIKSGIRAMRQRIAELQVDTTEGNDEERERVIEELTRIIDKRTKRKPPAAQNESTNVKATAAKPVISPTLVADSSRAIPSPTISQTVKPTRSPSQEIMPLPALADSLVFGDVSSYTVQDLEDLIRGPNIALADMPSSDSSEEDGEEEVLEEEPEEVQDKPSRSHGRIRYQSSSEEEEEEEDEEASPFVSSIIPLPIKSASELSNEDESFHSESFQGITSFHEVNGVGSSVEVDKTGDAAVNAAYALDFAHLSVPEISENGRKVVTDHILNAPDESQALEECEPETVPDVVKPPTIATSQSDPIEASDKPESPQSPIVSIEEDIHPLQSTPKTEVTLRTRNQRKNSALAQKTADLTVKPNITSQTGINGINNNSKSAKKMGGLKRITDLPVPINPATRVIKPGPAGLQARLQAVRAEEREAKADDQGPNNASQAKQKNGKLSSKTASTTKIPAKITKISSQTSVMSNRESLKTQSVTAVQDVLETMVSAPSNEEQSLASWAVLQGDSQPETETLEMMDELHSSPNMPKSPISIRKPTFPAAVNEVSKETDPLFLGSSQQSFPYSQYTGFNREPPGTEDEEDEVEASVVKPQTAIRSSSKFRSLTEIVSQPTLFTPILRLAETKDEVRNMYGRSSKGSEEESEESDTESDSEEAQTSHIPLSRRAGI